MHLSKRQDTNWIYIHTQIIMIKKWFRLAAGNAKPQATEAGISYWTSGTYHFAALIVLPEF